MSVSGDPLLAQVLVEGGADFIAQLVTGREPDAARAAWALPREAELWRQFARDIALTRATGTAANASVTPSSASLKARSQAEDEAIARWIGNYSNPPAGWPGEAGYWIGLRIWERYHAATEDKRAALRTMPTVRDPSAILQVGGFRVP